jgi:hypothetical protein
MSVAFGGNSRGSLWVKMRRALVAASHDEKRGRVKVSELKNWISTNVLKDRESLTYDDKTNLYSALGRGWCPHVDPSFECIGRPSRRQSARG